MNLTASSTMMIRGAAAVEMGVLGVNNVLVDGNGMTLYLFTRDSTGRSACTSNGCLARWPLLATDGDPVAGNGIDQTLLGTARHPNGATQATYNGNPLYYFAPDLAPGDARGQGVGGVWWVVSPGGSGITGAGLDGSKGEKGDRGSPGVPGASGRDGASGKNGAAGPAGPAGKNGADGNAGADGKNGAAGPAGPIGDKGAESESGWPGPQGVPGVDGASGPGDSSFLSVVSLVVALLALALAGGAFVFSRRA